MADYKVVNESTTTKVEIRVEFAEGSIIPVLINISDGKYDGHWTDKTLNKPAELAVAVLVAHYIDSLDQISEPPNTPENPDPIKAIEFVLSDNCSEPEEFLRDWMEGNWGALANWFHWTWDNDEEEES